MEGEIDLRPYFIALLRAWKWLIGAAVLGAMIGYAVSTRRQPLYEARALVAVTEPRYVLEFDPRFQNTESFRAPSYRAYPPLATGDEVLGQVLETLQPPISGLRSVSDLHRVLQAEAATDVTIVELSARLPDAADATRLVNTWATLFAQKANQVYSGRGAGQVAFLEGELTTAQANSAAAQQALVDFAAHDQSAVIGNQLAVYTQTHRALLSEQQALAQLAQDIAAMQAQLAARPAASQAAQADQLAVIQLQMRTFGAATAAPVTVDLGSGEPTTIADQQALLAGLQAAVTTLTAARQTDLAALEPQILAAQRQLQEMTAEGKRLWQTQQVADETYLTVARELDEARIAVQDTYGHVQVASQAVIPDQPAARSWLIPSAAVAVAAFLLASAAIVIRHWSKGLAAERPTPSPAATTSR